MGTLLEVKVQEHGKKRSELDAKLYGITSMIMEMDKKEQKKHRKWKDRLLYIRNVTVMVIKSFHRL